MSRAFVEIDRDVAAQAAAILGTTTLRDTIDASLREVVNAKRRLELVSLIGDDAAFDHEVLAADQGWVGRD